MRAALPMLQATPVLKGKDYREVLRQELDAGKIPISLGRSCPVQCEFCYELDHSYRETLEPPKTTQEDWEFILDYINKKPTRSEEHTSELQSLTNLVCRLLLEKKNI